MRKKSSPLHHAGQFCAALYQRVMSSIVTLVALSAFVGGMGAGVLYSNATPAIIEIHGTCDVKIPEFLIPSSS